MRLVLVVLLALLLPCPPALATPTLPTPAPPAPRPAADEVRWYALHRTTPDALAADVTRGLPRETGFADPLGAGQQPTVMHLPAAPGVQEIVDCCIVTLDHGNRSPSA